jgi:23S rRNA (pseudouridine1915-N3)-methyltransferase
MRLILLCVGKVREAWLKAAVDEYVGRLGHYLPVELVEARDPAAALKRLPPGSRLVALDERGVEWTTTELRRFVEREMVSGGRGAMAFLVGGAEGLPAEALARAEVKLSLSRLTLPHRIARLVLVEQPYRVMTMIRGEPYHRG